MKETVLNLEAVGPREFVNGHYEHRALPHSRPCEKCNTPTRYQVKVVDRWASWCGCGNVNDSNWAT